MNEQDIIQQDIIQFHLNTIEDILKLIDLCQNEPVTSTTNGLPITSEKLDELTQYTSKLKRFVSSIK